MIRRGRYALVGFFAALLAIPVTLPGEQKEGSKPASRAADAGEETPVKKVTLEEFEGMRAEKGEPKVVVLDVRTPKEFAEGRVPGAVHINWRARNFNDQVAKLDKSKKYLVYCLAGVRSAAAAERMRSLGFIYLYDFAGGWDAYEKASKPVEK